MKNYVKTIIVCGLFASCVMSPSSYAVSERMATYGAIGGGLAIGAAAGGLTYLGTSNLGTEKHVIAVLVGLGVAGGAWFALDYYLSQLTPSSRLTAANKIIRWIESDSLILRNFATMDEFARYLHGRYAGSNAIISVRCQINKLEDACDEALRLIELGQIDSYDVAVLGECEKLKKRIDNFKQTLKAKSIWVTVHEVDLALHNIEVDSFLSPTLTADSDFESYVNMRFGTSWPLVLARDFAITKTKSIEKSLATLEQIFNDILEQDVPGLIEKCKELVAKTQRLTDLLIQKTNMLLSREKYQFQVDLFEKAQLAERNRLHEEQLAEQQRKHEMELAERRFQHEKALKASERLHEGWERSLDRRQQHNEKEEDRRLKRQAITNAHRDRTPMIVNI